MRPLAPAALFVALFWGLGSCSQEAPSWQSLLAIKVHDHFSDYSVEKRQDGSLLVHRPSRPDVPVDVGAIARFCQRGPKDCNYATDQMLLELQKP